MAAPSGTPSSVFKHAIDLNRVSNSLQKPLAVAYNRILVKAARELQAMGVMNIQVHIEQKGSARLWGR